MHYLILLMLLGGCALKKGEAPLASPAPDIMNITFSWAGEREYVVKRTLIRNGADYVAEVPITLSSPVPQNLTIDSSLPLVGDTYIDATEAVSHGAIYPISGTIKEGRLVLSGIRSVLADDKDEQTDISLQARDSKTGERPWRIRFTLRTQPTRVGVQVFGRDAQSPVQALKSPNLRLDLLRVIKLKSDKEVPTFVVPKTNTWKGRIIRRFTEYGLALQECSHEQYVRDFSEQYETEFFLLPINEKLPGSWLTKVFGAAQFFELPRKSEITLGLYGSGKALAQFVDNGIPTQNATQVRVPIRCQRGNCDEGRRGCDRETIYGQGLTGTQGKDTQIYLENGVNRASLGYEVSSENGGTHSFDLLSPTLPLF